MLVSVDLDAKTLRSVVSAVPDEYDGTPLLSDVFFDAAPLQCHTDRMAVAGALLFSKYISGVLTFNFECHPETAASLQDFFSPVSVSVLSIDLKPRPIVAGDVKVMLDRADHAFGPTQVLRHNDHMSFRLASNGVGSFFSPRQVVIATNAPVLTTEDERSVFAWTPLVAGAVLFADDLFISHIILPFHYDRLSRDEQSSFARLKSVLQTVKISLEYSSPES